MNPNCRTKREKPFVVHPQGAGRGCKGHSPQQHTHSLSNHEWPFDRLRANGLVVFRQSGFTLVEVLVALFILAITMAAVSRTASSSIHHVEALRTRVIADWVAQNRLSLHQARGDWLPTGIQTGEEAQAGQTYPWREEVIATPNPTMRRIVVSVYAPNDAKYALRELTGYLVQYSR